MDKDENENVKPAMKGQARDAFKWWSGLSRIQAGDSFGKIIQRVLIHLAGIVFLIVFSPILLFALLIAFFAML